MGQRKMGRTYRVAKGTPYPLGATPSKKGVNFSVFSENATKMELLLFEKSDNSQPFQTISLSQSSHRTLNFWHVFVEGLKPGIFYAFRVDGPFDPKNGHRFNCKKILIDPYSKGIDYSIWKREDAVGEADNLSTSLRSVVIDTDRYNWEGDKPLNKPLDSTIIYELQVGNFTKSPTSGCKYPGKFKGVIEKIPYLKSLGVTAVELLPVFDFKSGNSKNIWGYGTTGFFAPESSYCITPSEASHVYEFRDLVKALHKAGLEVVLDVVLGYTTEGDQTGPTLFFKGFDNAIYYHLDPHDKENYSDFSGCTNSLNCNHPVVSKFIVDCLEYWVREMHVDGFRLDEASLLSRDQNAEITNHPHVLWNIDLSETLVNTKIFLEPWDAKGGYLVGKISSCHFVEWNDKFRDDIRKFVKGERGLVSTIASRLTGSMDLYLPEIKRHQLFLNFITAHDGFTLKDLVSYNSKHNEINGENNEDGLSENYSWNCGIEGDTNIDFINALREKQMKNFITLLLISKGVPLVTMGDEAARTQRGNNNAYCQDNELSWFDWDLVQKNHKLLEFFKRTIQLRKKYHFLNLGSIEDIKFHGCLINSPGWDDPNCRVLSFTLKNEIHVLINMDDQNLQFEVPDGRWSIVINTADKGIGAYLTNPEKSSSDKRMIIVESKSIVVLVAS